MTTRIHHLISLLLAVALSTTAYAQPPSGMQHDLLTAVARTANGQYLVGGYTSSNDAMETAAILSLLDSDGEPQWTAVYDSVSWDEPSAVMMDAAGNCWLAGATRPDEDLFDWWVCKYTEDGDLLWSQTYHPDYPSAAVDIVSDGSNGAFVTGYVEIDSDKNIGLSHINSAGEVQWSWISEFEDHHNVSALERLPDGSLVIAGQGNDTNEDASDIYVAQFTPAGTLMWETEIDMHAAQHCTGLCVTTSGDLVVTGSTLGDTTAQETDGLLLKLDAEGQLIWGQQLGDSDNDRITDAVALSGDSLLACGMTQDPITHEMLAALYLVDPDGETVWTRVYGYRKHAEFRAVDAASSSSFMAVGFGDTGGPAYMADYFVATALTAKVSEPTVLPAEFSALVYPNPTNAFATIEINLPSAGEMTVTLTNVLGQQVSTVADGWFTAGIHHFSLGLGTVASGTYYVDLQGADISFTPVRIVVVK